MPDPDAGRAETGPPDGPGLLAPSEAERAQAARARGLSAPYVPGGSDPDLEDARREERFYGRLLVVMVVAILSVGIVLAIVTNVLTALGGR